MERISVLLGHLDPKGKKGEGRSSVRPQNVAAFRPPSPDDIVVVSALRTPICKANRGAFKDTFPDDLLAAAYKAVMDQVKVNPTEIGDICVGNVQEGTIGLLGRAAQFYCGIPEDVPCYSTNRQCASGLQAFMNVAGSIRNGQTKVGLAGGVECMTRNTMGMPADQLNPRIFESQLTQDILTPMGITSENVSKKFGQTREELDKFGLESQQKAGRAAKLGYFDAEITPVEVTVKDKEGNERKVLVSKDEGIRPTTLENLARLKPAFQQDGLSTAGNSSQRSDGAAAVLVTTRGEAQRRGWPILGVQRSYAVVGCPPSIMGIGPAVAIPVALQKAGLTVQDVDIFEINEAFASQAKYCVDKLGIPPEKVNPKGGAIALGHPLGCTGTRMISTLLHELKRRQKRSYGVVSMCMGTGMGAAAVFEFPGA